MLSITRYNRIKEIIAKDKSALVSDLAEMFSVTEETIRRDLKKLESEGLATRVYGGAYSIEGVQGDIKFSLREGALVLEKQRIANAALSYISNGDSIFLDCSTTALQLAGLLSEYSLTIVTNSLKVSDCLSSMKDIKLVLLGGILDKKSMSFLGHSTYKSFNSCYVDKAFLSPRTVSVENGLTDSNEDQATIRRISIEHSKQSYLLADHTKIGGTSFCKISDLTNVTTMITDSELPDNFRSYLNDNNVNLLEAL